MNYAASCLI